MLVSQLSKELNISADTIRYYTRCGLLTPQGDSNGYKRYSEKDIQRLRFILSAKQLGFKLSDIQSLLGVADTGSTPCPVAREILAANLHEMERTVNDSLSLLKRMQKALKKWEDMPDQQPSGDTICSLIETWAEELK